MPANLTADYRKAEEAYRAAREPKEKLDCLKEMLRTIPKHKGTDHLQGDIKRKIKETTEELSAPKKGARRQGPVHTIRAEGAAQVALIGPPNAGKSALHQRLTSSRSEIGPYPGTTREPIPGMAPYEDVLFQLIDLPPVSADHCETWIVNALQPADAALLVIDLTDPDCAGHVEGILKQLGERRIHLKPRWPGIHGPEPEPDTTGDGEGEEILDPFRIELPTLLVINKADLTEDAEEELGVLQELLGLEFPHVLVSAETGEGCEQVSEFLFRGLEVIRVYTKAPGKPANDDRPFTLRRGQTVIDVAQQLHKDIASSLRYARVWGTEVYAGQQVGPEHKLADKDVLELHMR
jgi:ribosome-interacting GTPase 1